MEMVMESLNPAITFEDLAYIDPQMRRFDRKLIWAVKQIIPEDSQLNLDILTEDTMRTRHGSLPLTSKQLLRLFFQCAHLANNCQCFLSKCTPFE